MAGAAIDWGHGRYEGTAAKLLPAARVVVDRAALRPGERVVDVGCGTGNAALLAAERGARAVGIDPAGRLLEVARAEAAARDLDATFVEGDAAALGLGDASADVLLSVFAIIFAPDPAAAAAELARVSAPVGRIVLSAWIPDGAIAETSKAAREAVTAALGVPAGPPPFSWHDPGALAGLLAPHGFEVEHEEHRLAFTASSAEAFMDADFREHPLSIAGRAVLEPRGEADALRARMLTILEAANEDAAAFRVTSRYVVATARRAS